ncbi:rhomboid family intramembrane serine protease [Aurantimonas marianensis]
MKICLPNCAGKLTNDAGRIRSCLAASTVRVLVFRFRCTQDLQPPHDMGRFFVVSLGDPRPMFGEPMRRPRGCRPAPHKDRNEDGARRVTPHQSSRTDDETTDRGRYPPAFNVPGIILILIAIFAVIHAIRVFVLGPVAASDVLLDFAFIPGCYGDVDEICGFRSPGADLWTPISYAFLHGDWTHLGVNAVWLLAFGTPVARRLGTARFVGFSCAGAVVGAAAFSALNPTLVAPVIGASGIVSALMGGACCFAFGGRGRTRFNPARADLPVVSIADALGNRTVLVFIAVFFATNLLIGSGVGGAFGGGSIAWEAHLGGFAFGFLAFRLFDPLSRIRTP